MPRAPEYDSAQVSPQALPAARIPVTRDAESFGGGPSRDRVYQAAGGLTESLSKIAESEQEKADKIAVLEASRKATEAETAIQTEVKSNYLGKRAAEAHDYATQEWERTMEDIDGSLNTPRQRAMFRQEAVQMGGRLNRSVRFHEVEEFQRYDNQETAGAVEASRSYAVNNAMDDQAVNQELARQAEIVGGHADRLGNDRSTETHQQAVRKQTSETVKAVISSRLDAGYVKSAESFFEGQKAKMTDGDIASVQKAIEDARVLTDGTAIWSGVKNLRLPDGTLDEGKIRDATLSQGIQAGFSPARREKVWQYVKARIGEAIVEEHRENQARDTQFWSTVLGDKRQGMSMTDALKIAAKPEFSKNLKEQAIKEDLVRKIYNPTVPGDPVKETELWLGIQRGTVNQEHIEAARQSEEISPQEYKSLTHAWYDSKTNPEKRNQAWAWAEIEDMGREKFGSDRHKLLRFIRSVQMTAEGKSAPEILKAAEDQLKTTKSEWWGLKTTKAFQETTSNFRSAQKDLGAYSDSMGKDVVAAIGQGLGKNTFEPQDIKAFADQFGGVEKVRPGTPVYNAIQLLIQQKKTVTKTNVDYAIGYIKRNGVR